MAVPVPLPPSPAVPAALGLAAVLAPVLASVLAPGLAAVTGALGAGPVVAPAGLSGVGTAALQSPVLDPRVGFAFGAGVVTFFAPCAYPLLPGYVAYFLGNEDGEGTAAGRLVRATTVGLVTSAGFFVVYAGLVGVVLAVGTGPLREISVLELVVGLTMVGLGLGMASGRFDPTALHVRLPERRRGVTGYFAFGVVYAAAAAGCTAPVFIGTATSVLTAGPATAVAAFGAYAGGMALLMVAVTTLSAVGRATLLRRVSERSRLLSRVAGAVLAVAGVVQVYLFLFEYGGLRTLGLA